LSVDDTRGLLDSARREAAPWLVAALVLVELAWYGRNVGAQWGSPALGWIPSVLGMVIGTGTAFRMARGSGLDPAARRFWLQIAASGGMSSVSLSVMTIYTARAADGVSASSILPLPSVLISGAAMLLAVRALLQVPVGPRTRGQWIRLLLDLATVGLGAALIAWYATLGPLLLRSTGYGQGPNAPVPPVGGAAGWGALGVAVICLAGVTAIAKIVLAGAGPVDMRALLLLGGGLLAGGISAGTVSVVVKDSAAAPGQLVIPFVAVMFTLSARRQRMVAEEHADDTAPPWAPRPERTYSLLPYAAVIATDVLLVLAVKDRVDARGGVVVGGAIAVTAVVTVRQFIAFLDNARMVRQLRDQEERLRHQADHDGLTELANRALFTERLDDALGGADPVPGVAVLLIDLDDFKTVNDTLGHPVGDTLLRAVADRLRHCIRATDTVARLGGDEFGVLLRGVEPETADSTAKRILASLASPVVAGDHRLLIRASVGVAIASSGDDSGVTLRNADIAMYAAKERGKGGHARYVPGMATNVLEHARLGAQLREAIDAGQLYPLFQPIVDMTEQRVVGVETLIRWRHPTRGIVLPTEFIRTAERTGLIVAMGRYVLHEAFHQYARWRRELGPIAPDRIAVNVASRQLAEPEFPNEVADAIAAAGLDPVHVVLEMTEDAVLTGGQAIEALRALDALGVHIALDDFGTGQSSLGLLRTCPVRILKLDKSFVDGIAEGTQQAAIATAVVRMAQALELDTVAEGIEHEQQVDFLLGMGYRFGQGFHLGRPLPAGEVEQLFGRAGPDRLPEQLPEISLTRSERSVVR
jgi:diguanylate cyclase (GGDEF)-like protein